MNRTALLGRALALAVALTLPMAALAGTKITGTPKVSFFAVGHPAMLNIEGTTTKMTLVDDGTSLVFSVPMSTVDSGVSLRDAHMRDNYIQVSKFPDAKLTLKKADVAFPASGSTSVKIPASFEVHGVAKPVTVQATLTKTGTGWRVKARFDYDTEQHGIFIESYMGVTIDPKQYATVVVDLVDAP